MSVVNAIPPLLNRVLCPQCWHKFHPEEILWISEHQDLFGSDNRVPNAQKRFLPSRFTPQAEAIDPRGFPCHRLACPNCHLEIPRPLLELQTLVMSVLGSPGSGKSYFLAAMASQLRHVLPLKFFATFADADATLNFRLKESERQLFANSNPQQMQELGELIQKTQEVGDEYGYASVNFGSQAVNYLRPYAFTMQVQENHPNPERRGAGRAICLFDNAGESFLPGMDKSASPVTRHLAESRVLFFVYDPLQDSRFRGLDIRLNKGVVDKSHLGSQEGVFQEAANRIRRYSGLSSRAKYPRPVIVVVTKCDRWAHLIDAELLDKSAIVPLQKKLTNGTATTLHALDVELIKTVSTQTRNLLSRVSPEIVSAVESFTDYACYVPVSATGPNTRISPKSGLPTVRPGELKSFWAEIPFIYSLAISSSGMIPKVTR